MENKWEVNGFYNGNEWEVNLEMKMDKLMGNELEINLENDLIITNEWIVELVNEWRAKLIILEQTLNNNVIQNNLIW